MENELVNLAPLTRHKAIVHSLSCTKVLYWFSVHFAENTFTISLTCKRTRQCEVQQSISNQATLYSNKTSQAIQKSEAAQTYTLTFSF